MADESASLRPRRTCVGCHQAGPASDLVRLNLNGEGRVVPAVGHPHGRGAWIHPAVDCVRRASRSQALQRAFRRPVTVGPDELAELVGISHEASSAAGGRNE